MIQGQVLQSYVWKLQSKGSELFLLAWRDVRGRISPPRWNGEPNHRSRRASLWFNALRWGRTVPRDWKEYDPLIRPVWKALSF